MIGISAKLKKSFHSINNILLCHGPTQCSTGDIIGAVNFGTFKNQESYDVGVTGSSSAHERSKAVSIAMVHVSASINKELNDSQRTSGSCTDKRRPPLIVGYVEIDTLV